MWPTFKPQERAPLLVCGLMVLVAACHIQAHTTQDAPRTIREAQLSLRNALELAQEREQVLAAQQSIADWRKSLHHHHHHHGQDDRTDDDGAPGQKSRPVHRRRKKRADRNDLYPTAEASQQRETGRNETETVPNGAEPPPDDGDDPEASVVCYGPLGCFHETDHLPEMLPSSPAEVNTRFLVYTTTHRSEKPLIEFSYEELVVAGFGAAYWANGTNDTATIPVATGAASSLLQTFGDLGNRTVRVIVHGFGANCGLVWIYEMRTALMAVENCTVICVDWENGAKLPNYVRAAANTRLVGRQLALLLRLLRTHNALRLSRVHLIGFSLGSHVAGFAGAEFSNVGPPSPSPSPSPSSTGPTAPPSPDTVDDEEVDELDDDLLRRSPTKDDESTTEPTVAERPTNTAGLWRITGLDPAGPLFEAQPPEVRLDAGDARYVDVIHSNGENLILGGLGSWQPMGTVDYYPNGGRVQHGCTNLFVGAVTDIIWAPPTTVEGRSLCNHRRAYKFFIDSVAPRCHFPAFPCESYDQFAAGECFECGGGGSNGTHSACGHMGYYATSRDVGGYGQLYLRTRDEEPYCANQFRLRLRNAPDELPLRTVGRFELTLEGGDTGNGIDDGLGGGNGAAGGTPLLTFNETFHLDEAREDREFHAGQWLTTILVPHPALGHRPRALTITYRPYRGGWWQRSSVGRQLWRIGPLLLTADDQRTYGSCETLTLQADVPVRVELRPIVLLQHPDGDTPDGADDDHGCAAEGVDPERRPAAVNPPRSSIDELVGARHPGGGTHDHFSWTPVAISIPRHGSPHHQVAPPHVNEKRSFSETSSLVGAESSSPTGGGGTLMATSTTTTQTAQTVQLFPSRLVSFFERAERYARRTWDALFSGNVTGDPKMGRPSGTVVPDDEDSAAGAAYGPITTVVDLLTGVPPSTTTTQTSATTSTTIAPSTTMVPNVAITTPSSTSMVPTSVPEIRIALPTFRPPAIPARLIGDGPVMAGSSGRQHFTRFIPLVYDEEQTATDRHGAGGAGVGRKPPPRR